MNAARYIYVQNLDKSEIEKIRLSEVGQAIKAAIEAIFVAENSVMVAKFDKIIDD